MSIFGTHRRYKQTKTKRSTREIELINPAIQWLQAQRTFTELLKPQRLEVMSRDNKKRFSEDVRSVFLNSSTQVPHYSDNAVRDRFWRAQLKKASVRYRGPNSARHTFISQLLTAGIPKEWIVRQVGHTSSRMIDEHSLLASAVMSPRAAHWSCLLKAWSLWIAHTSTIAGFTP